MRDPSPPPPTHRAPFLHREPIRLFIALALAAVASNCSSSEATANTVYVGFEKAYNCTLVRETPFSASVAASRCSELPLPSAAELSAERERVKKIADSAMGPLKSVAHLAESQSEHKLGVLARDALLGTGSITMKDLVATCDSDPNFALSIRFTDLELTGRANCSDFRTLSNYMD